MSEQNGFKIEDDIPVPSRLGLMSVLRYPFADMRVGQSFMVTFTEDRRRRIEAVRKAVMYRQKTNAGERYCTRTVEGGIRVWRIA